MGEEHLTSSVQQSEPKQTLSSFIDGLDRPATVLLSYAREDTEAVKDLQLRLHVRGIRCWRDEDNLLAGSAFEPEIVHAIEHEVDAVALYITPDFLKSDFIWKIEVPAALRRQEANPDFHIVPILRGVSFPKVRQFCLKRNLADLSRFNAILLTEDGSSTTWEEQNKTLNQAAERILRAALTLHLRRIKADHSYEPRLCLKTFAFAPTKTLDLDLNWQQIINEQKRVPTLQEWEQILLPALRDVKQTISEKVSSCRVHLFIKSILPIAIALGFTFRKSSRFTLLVEGQKETWHTEAQPSEKEPLHGQLEHNDQGDPKVAVVGVATTRSIKQAVADALPALGLTPGFSVQLELPELSEGAVRDAAHAQAIAQQVGRVCQDLCDRRRVAHIHLFVALPVELAVLIGQQLNALCPITLYQFHQQTQTYKLIGSIH